MPRSSGWTAIATAMVVAALVAGGCGSGGGPAQPQPPPTPVGTASIAGVVVSALDVSQVIPFVNVTVTPPGTSLQAAADGTFIVDNLPAGTVELRVDPGPNPGYTSTVLSLHTAKDVVTRVVITLVPLQAGIPDRVTVQPAEVSLDPGAEQQFTATVWSGAVQLNVAPSWIVEGGIGTIDAAGKFVAEKPGQGKVVAVAGQQRGEASVTVTGPTPPRLWSFFVDPQQLPPSGGEARFTAHVSDGDGIDKVRLLVYKPDGTRDVQLLQRTAGTDKDGTWTGTYVFPRNTASIDEMGNQQAQTYDVRLTIIDKSGDYIRSGFRQVTVLGIEAPPPPIKD